MAVRKFNFTVKEDGITPATEQRAGIQSEHGVTQLNFNIEDRLYSKLLTEKGENSLVYRFDCYDSVGGTVRSDTKELVGSEVSFKVGENLTRHGGRAAVYLIVSVYNSDNKTELELLSYPAKLRFESIPSAAGENGEERESLSTLAEAAKNAAERAADSKSAAETAQSKTEQAQRVLESGSEFFFDGGDSSGYAKAGLVVDSELSETSENPVENKAVTLKIKELRNLISSTVSLAINEKNQKDYPLGKVLMFADDTDPATLYGGTWKRTAKGKAIVGVDEDDEDFATAGLTLGEKKHQTTTEEMPEHYHKAEEDKTHEQGAAYARSYGGVDSNAWGSEAGGYAYLKDINTSKVGGNQPHNNIQPSMTFYIWTRVA